MSDLPSELPLLSGIAEDYVWSEDEEEFGEPKKVESKPRFVSDNTVTLPKLPSLATEVPGSPQVQPPPPPPPPSSFEFSTSIESEKSNESAKCETPKAVKPEKLKSSAAVPPADKGRAALLEDIRNFKGKFPANNAKQRKIQQKQKKKEEGVVVTGDLIGDLKSRLQMRRHGISGNKKIEDPVPNAIKEGFKTPSTSNSAMDKVSALIPPPKPAASESERSDDSDWNENI